jgi:hypothetical protein
MGDVHTYKEKIFRPQFELLTPTSKSLNFNITFFVDGSLSSRSGSGLAGVEAAHHLQLPLCAIDKLNQRGPVIFKATMDSSMHCMQSDGKDETATVGD